MKFMDRASELKYLREAAELSKKKVFTLSIAGLRRVGKTRLILEVLGTDDLYFFVNRDKGSDALLREYEEVLRGKKILKGLESLKSWDDFFSVLFERFRGTIAFDEFQNFASVERSVYGTLQKYIDMHEHGKNVLLIFSGSTVGMIKRLFSDSREPLYGRLKRKLFLKPLLFRDVSAICRELGIGFEEAVSLYAIFGGFPRYYVTIEDEGLQGKGIGKILERLFFAENAVLEDEASQILSLEFGRRSGLYHGILAAIASGNTKISEVASYLRKKETALTRQVNELVHYFELVGVEKPVTGGKSLLFIRHPLMNFWFRFFYRDVSSYNRRERWLLDKIRGEINAYVGKGFEGVCREFVEMHEPGFERVGRWWGAYRDAKTGGRKTAEIDVVALNEKTKEALFCECKWQDNADAKKLLAELRGKARLVQWNGGGRKERYALFAKSFRERVKEPGLDLFDLKDLEKGFSQS